MTTLTDGAVVDPLFELELTDLTTELASDGTADPLLAVGTDQLDYAPGSTATVTATGVEPGGTVEFEVEHVASAGDDGIFGTIDDVTVDLGGEGHDPWIVTDGGEDDLDGEANGIIVTQWYVNPDDSLGATFLLTAQQVEAGEDGIVGTGDDVQTGAPATASFTDNLVVDFKQAANNNGEPGGLGDIDWIGSIIQTSNSVYFEGMSVMQRVVLEGFNDALNDGNINIRFGHDATKAGIHAYDWLTSWDQAITAAVDAGVPFDNVQEDPNQNALHVGTENNLTLAEASDEAIGPPATLDEHVVDMRSLGTDGQVFYIDVIVPDDPFISHDGATQTRIDAYEAVYGNRTIRVYSNQEMTGGTLSLTHSVPNGGDTGDTSISYSLDIDFVGAVTTSTQIMLEFAGHIAKGADADGWGDGNGASSISGGPYHFDLDSIDGATLGANDNQIKGADVLIPGNPELNIVKEASVPGGTADTAGELISYTITVQNTGSVTLTGVTVTDPFADAVPGIVRNAIDVVGDEDNLLEVGETWGYTAQHTVTQAEIDAGGNFDGDDAGTAFDQLRNVATADSNETGEDTDDASVPVEQRPSLNITKDASVPGGTADTAGELISYTITVQNTGNVTLTGVTVTDPFADAVPGIVRNAIDVVGDEDNLLEVGETWGYTAQHTVTQAEIDAGGNFDGDDAGTAFDQLRNVATADSNETGEDTDDASVPVEQRPSLNITKDASVPGGTADTAGELISYTITVQNTGNVTLTGVTVTDPFADAVPGIVRNAIDVVGDEDNLLEVGETWGYTAQHTVTQAEIDAGGNFDGDDAGTAFDQLRNVATADSNETGEDTDDASVPVEQRPSLNITKDASVPGGTADTAGELISYTITVQNTGNVTLTGVTVTDPFADAVPGIVRNAIDVVGDEDNLLEVGETWGYTAQHTVTQAEIDAGGNFDGDDAGTAFDQLRNVATADSNETGEDTDDASVPVEQRPSLNITKDASVPGGTADTAGELISYTITVQNTGNVTLTGVTVTDPFADAVPGIVRNAIDVVGDEDNLLEVGETWGYTAQHTVTQAEIDAGGNFDGDDAGTAFDQLRNVATADSNETGEDTDDASVPVEQRPSLNITKDASVPGGTADTAGELISYTITVQNTGNVTLTGVTVTDPFADAVPGIVRNAIDVVGDEDNLLEVGETWGYTAQHTVTQAEIDAGGNFDGDDAGTAFDQLRNVATADSNETGEDTDDASVPVEQRPSLNITKDASVPGGTADTAGELISYTITVQNTGNVTLTGVTVTDPFADAVPGIVRNAIDVVGDEDNLLEVGETWGYTAQHTVTQAEIDAGGNFDGDDAGTAFDQLRNVATADSNETGEDTDDASVPVEQRPSLNITKDASVPGGTADTAGELISYTITVQNTGNVTLTGVTVTDPFADAVPGIVRNAIDVVGDEDNLLEVGETWGYTAQHTVTQAEIDAGGNFDGDDAGTAFDQLRNVATADSNETGEDTDDASVPVEQRPSLNITKDASVPGGTADTAGELISYTITVQNTGNVTLTGVTVTDPFADAVPGIVRNAIDVVGDEDNLLEVGETWGYTAQHTVTQAEIDAGGNFDGDDAGTAFDQLRNVATADSNETGEDTDDASVPVEQRPSLNITKDASVPGGTADTAGELISYTITVQNTGNVTLTGVTVTDPFADAVPGIVRNAIDVVGDEDNLLEVGETWGYTAQHTVTQAEIDAGGNFDGDDAGTAFDQLRNVATADSNETGEDTDDASVPVEQRPSLNITKDASVPGGTADTAGELISYTITVQNTGNVTLTGVTVTDPFADAVPGIVRNAIDVVGDEDNLLEVGETWGYTAQHTVTQAEIDAGGNFDGDDAGTAFDQLRNVATADSNETGEDTDDASVPVEQRPSLNITKDASVPGGTADTAGELISYTITVQNTGNVTLTGVTVTDPFADAVPGIVRNAIDVVGDEDNLLEVGETWGYTAQHTVTQAEIDAGGNFDGDDAGTAFDQLRNVATADSNETGPDTDDASVPVEQPTGPGVRTPGFWHKPGLTFWDGDPANQAKSGPNFPAGELLYPVDSNNDDIIDGTVGLLIGDYNKNGLTDSGEDTFFITLGQARIIIDASQKVQQDTRFVLGRDAVATWLNYLAGNAIGEASDPNSPHKYLDQAIDWLQVTNHNPTPDPLANALRFEDWGGGAAVKAGSGTIWNVESDTEAATAGNELSGNVIHQELDFYNNTGKTFGPGGVTYTYATDGG